MYKSVCPTLTHSRFFKGKNVHEFSKTLRSWLIKLSGGNFERFVAICDANIISERYLSFHHDNTVKKNSCMILPIVMIIKKKIPMGRAKQRHGSK